MIDRMHKSQKKAEGCSPGTGNQMRTRKDEATGLRKNKIATAA